MDEFDLSDFFLTKAQANDFSTRLSTVMEKIYQTDFNLDKVLLEQLGVAKTDKFITFLRTNNIPKEGNELKTFLGKILEKVTTIPVLSLTVAFDPSEKVLQSVAQWCLLNIKKQVVFDITVDKKLIAGATVSFNGKHADFSIKETFNQIVKTVVRADVSAALKIKSHTTNDKEQSTEFFSLGR